VPAGFPTPVAGVVGQLNERIDVDLLSAVADTGVGLVLVGPRNARWSPTGTKALLSRTNVHHVGAVPFEDVPRWLARIDVGLTPYTDSGFNRASFPLKTLEYLAAGLPVVSTDLPASRRLRQQTQHVWIASEPRSFADAVLQAASCPSGFDVVAQRRAVAELHSWATRADEFARLAGLSA
jgi:teichuronic acid biosynthesis glycosyltransferase TuaH